MKKAENIAILRSTNGDGNVALKFHSRNENIVFISATIKRRTYGVSEAVDFIEFMLPNYPCFKHAILDLVDKLSTWSNADLDTISNSPLYIEKELSAADYTMNNSFIIQIGDPEIHRSVPDQRKLSLKWDVGFAKFETSFIIDPTGVRQFTDELEKIEFLLTNSST